MANSIKSPWTYLRGLVAPLLLWALFVAALLLPSQWWSGDTNDYDRAALEEWLGEARVPWEALPELARGYLDSLDAALDHNPNPLEDPALQLEAEKIHEHLKSLATPLTKKYSQQLPLFPVIYRMQVRFAEDRPGMTRPKTGRIQCITWESGLPRNPTQYKRLPFQLNDRAWVEVDYHLHAFNKQQQDEQLARERSRQLLGLGLAGTVPALVWMYLSQRREHERERQRALAQHQLDQAERLLLEEELRRREAEHSMEEAERSLLKERLVLRDAEQRSLELKSQIYASISIMAGSYAHNIKNLLVRPNDLLARCLEEDGLSQPQEQMLHEVRATLGTVTERLQQILRTVRRDPTQGTLTRLDLNAVLRELASPWQDLAREKWKLTLTLELSAEPLWINADLSHLQQAVENLLFNARDATFEMRNHQRNLARAGASSEGTPERKQALIAAAAWKGRVVVRTRREREQAVLEVQDNGIGMTEEVRRRCTETHFSTKRGNALYAGHSTGMGLGLSFVTIVLEHHGASLDIESEPLHGTTFRIAFPVAHLLPSPLG
jgi:signal transduction histidine kinase